MCMYIYAYFNIFILVIYFLFPCLQNILDSPDKLPNWQSFFPVSYSFDVGTIDEITRVDRKKKRGGVAWII